MSKSILFVCQSCHTSEAKAPDRPSDGTILLEQLLNLHQAWSRRSELEIQPVGCLWTCDHPCAVALSASNKSTYLLAKVPVAENSLSEVAVAVLHFSQLYLDSPDGTIPWKQFPEVLQTEIVARIPPIQSNLTNEP
ncbi:DUF1636 domain-containing protein [Pantanalinema rosaneae CENA516]|uniref:DUF1636 domain-containing protein n=1 Tax=Pantanalinema rosaneae TaxID=1620701 RepID=UPI003D6FA237